ncbi:MAG: hypothetical protein H7X88_01730 [Gloeobacteraceae cyanobacterium ES-bin-316]|nr:hypothetical protein [Ferruginibacter sp.]
MSSFIAGFMSLKKLKEIVETVEEKDLKGFNFTMSIGEESNEYGQNVAMFAEQTKEQRDEKQPRYYCGNGKVYWTDGKISLGSKSTMQKELPPTDDDLTGVEQKEEKKASVKKAATSKKTETPDPKDDLPF